MRVVIALDVASRRSQVRMTGKLLNVAQTTADFADFSGRAGDESSPAGMAGTAHHPEVGIQAMEPHDDGSRRQTAVAFTMDDRHIGSSLFASIAM